MSDSVPVKETRRSLVVDEGGEAIGRHTRENGLRPGARLPTEAAFAASLRCSRHILREALGRLSSLGLVEVRRGAGMFVRAADGVRACATLHCSSLAISTQELVEFTEFRSVIESHAACQAVLRGSDAELAELKAMGARIDEPRILREESVRRDQAVHLRRMEIGGNGRMAMLLESLLEFSQASMDLTTENPRDTDVRRELHAAISEALCRRDSAAAVDALELNRRHTMSGLGDRASMNGERGGDGRSPT